MLRRNNAVMKSVESVLRHLRRPMMVFLGLVLTFGATANIVVVLRYILILCGRLLTPEVR